MNNKYRKELQNYSTKYSKIIIGQNSKFNVSRFTKLYRQNINLLMAKIMWIQKSLRQKNTKSPPFIIGNIPIGVIVPGQTIFERTGTAMICCTAMGKIKILDGYKKGQYSKVLGEGMKREGRT